MQFLFRYINKTMIIQTSPSAGEVFFLKKQEFPCHHIHFPRFPDYEYLITSVDFADGGIDWENCVHVPMKRWEEAKNIQIQNGDLLITKDGTIGKDAIVSDIPSETSLNSGVLRVMSIEGYSRRFLYWVIKSDEFIADFLDEHYGKLDSIISDLENRSKPSWHKLNLIAVIQFYICNESILYFFHKPHIFVQ